MVKTLEELGLESAKWSVETFKNQTPEGKAAHILREAKELLENPTDGKEMADVFLLLYSLVYITGVDLRSEVEQKMEINFKRKWGAPNEDGSVSHIE